jgi:hypothetical protein
MRCGMSRKPTRVTIRFDDGSKIRIDIVAVSGFKLDAEAGIIEREPEGILRRFESTGLMTFDVAVSGMARAPGARHE